MKNKLILAAFFFLAAHANGQTHLAPNDGIMQRLFHPAEYTIAYPSSLSANRDKEVVGSQFLFKTWVKGNVTNNEGVKFSKALINFDKVSQTLYLQLDDTATVFQVDKSYVKSVFLSDGVVSYNLEKVPSLNTNFFYNELVKGKYSLYSFIKTTFIPSNFQTNGLVSSGNRYDEFKDEIIYYLVFPDGSSAEVPLKKKAIKGLFVSEKNKVDDFLKKNDQMPADEKLLFVLVEYLNNSGSK